MSFILCNLFHGFYRFFLFHLNENYSFIPTNRIRFEKLRM